MTQTAPFSSPAHPGHFYEVCERCNTHLGGCKCIGKARVMRDGNCGACQDLSDEQALSLAQTNSAK
jgi:hypothetical protein